MARELMNDDTFEVCETDLEGVAHPDPDVYYTLRAVSHAKVQAIRKRWPHDNQSDLRSNALLDYALVDWRGVVSGGQALPCEARYKTALPPDVVQAIGAVVLASRRSVEDRDDSFRATDGVG